jgi:hypothetical protein
MAHICGALQLEGVKITASTAVLVRRVKNQVMVKLENQRLNLFSCV